MSDNQRVRLSKQLLRQSLLELLNEKSIHKISVREICEGAQVNRSTFYKYYGSQYDLFKEMEDEILNHVNDQLKTVPYEVTSNLPMVTKLVAFIGDNAPLCRVLINHNVDPNFPDALINVPTLRRWVENHFPSAYTQTEMEYVYGLVVNGGYTIIKMWLNKDNREPPEVIAGILGRTIAKLFSGAEL